MSPRAVVLVAVVLLAALSAPSHAAPKASKKKGKGAVSKAVKPEPPKPAPDNLPPPADNGARAEAPPAPPAAPLPTAAALHARENRAAEALGNDAEYGRRLIVQAIDMGLLKEGAGAEALTPELLSRMIDVHVLRDAIRHGLLPANASPAQVTPELRAVMKRKGWFIRYYPDGSVNPNYGLKSSGMLK